METSSSSRFSAKEIVEQLLSDGTVTICIGAEALSYLKRLVSQQKYEQEKVLRTAGLLPASDVQRIRYSYDAEAGVCKITLSNPVRFEVLNPAVTPAVERVREEAQAVAAIPSTVNLFRRCPDGVVCSRPVTCSNDRSCDRGIYAT